MTNQNGVAEIDTLYPGILTLILLKSGYYEPRPSHIHFKFSHSDTDDYLVSQLYFNGDPRADGYPAALKIDITPSVVNNGFYLYFSKFTRNYLFWRMECVHARRYFKLWCANCHSTLDCCICCFLCIVVTHSLYDLFPIIIGLKTR